MAKRRERSLEATAFHEAGHAVCCLVQRIRLTSITVVASSDYWGSVSHSNPLHGMHIEYDDSPRAQRRIEQKALVCLAGIAAQQKYNPRSVRHWHWSSDRHDALKILGYLTRSDEELAAYFRLIEIRARGFVANPMHWKAITNLAHKVVRCGTLAEEEIRQSIYATFQNPLAREK